MEILRKKLIKNGEIMNKGKRIQTIFLQGVFICYILFLIKLLFLSRVSLSELFTAGRTLERSINLIPFYSIKEYIFSNSATIKDFAFSNVIGNIVIFIPVGTYLLLFKSNKSIRANLLLIFMATFLIETIQGLLAIGATDIDDMILNCLGGLVGILACKLLLLILRDEKKVEAAITVISAIGLPILLYLFFFVKLRL